MTKPDERQNIRISRPILVSNINALQTPSLATRVARWLLQLHSATSAPPSSPEDPVEVVCISDTHNSTPEVPAGDIIIHSGDLTQHGTFGEVQAQLNWLHHHPHAHKIVIAGNHDRILDAAFVAANPAHELAQPGKSAQDLDWGDLVYLEDGEVEITVRSRTLKVFGSPYVPQCGNFAFQYDPSRDFWAGRVPDDAAVVVTHGPPALHRDGDKGCRFLLKELWRVQPSLAVFGHIHFARGHETMMLSQARQSYESDPAGTSSWLALPRLLWWLMLERRRTQVHLSSLTFVNAACYEGESSIAVSI